MSFSSGSASYRARFRKFRGTGRATAAGITAVGLVAAAAVVGPGVAWASGDPSYTRTLGGPGHAMLYPSGLEVGPDGSVVVADTGNDKVSKYSAAGVLQWEVTQLVGDDGPLENTRDIAIAADGHIYVADAGRARIVKLDAGGNQVGDPWRGPTADKIGSPIGISEKNGLIYVADGNKKKVRVFDPTGTQVNEIGSTGACQMAAIRDADADDAGNVYVANYTKQNMLKMSPTGECLHVWGSKGSAPGQFKNPYGVRIAVDPIEGESVYVADSNNNRIQIFDLDGNFRYVVGADGDPDDVGTFTTNRRVAVAADGDVWGADLWGSRAVRFDRTPTGFSYAQTIGNGLAPLTDNAVFNEVRGVAISADGTVNAIDTVNQRLVTMTYDGQVLGSCGGRSERTISINWPRDVAVDPATGDRWVADTKQNRLQVWPETCTPQARVGGGGAGSGLGQFHWPHAIEIRAADRIAFVADTKNDRVLAYDVATRTALHAFGTEGSGAGQFFEPRGIAVASDDTVLVADTRNDRIVRLSYSPGTGFGWLATYGTELAEPEGLATESDGTIWIADTGNNRVVLLSATGAFERDFEAADGLGLNAPASVAVDSSDRAYVSDTQNDRIVVFANGSDPTPPGPDTTAPDTTITFPVHKQVLSQGTVTLQGEATDDSAVAGVQVALKDRDSGQWWNGTSWQSGLKWLDAALDSPGATTSGYSWDFTGGAEGGSYWTQSRAVDGAGNVDATKPSVRFDFEASSETDTTAPDTTITSPVLREVVPVGDVPVTGLATDDTAVASVVVAVKDRVSGMWWNGTSWQSGLAWLDADLVAPGATSTTYSWTFAGAAAGGSYWLQSRAVDAAGNVDPTRPGLRFDVEAA